MTPFLRRIGKITCENCIIKWNHPNRSKFNEQKQYLIPTNEKHLNLQKRETNHNIYYTRGY